MSEDPPTFDKINDLGPPIPFDELHPSDLVSSTSGFAFWAALSNAPHDPETRTLAALMKRAIVAWIDDEQAAALCKAIDGCFVPKAKVEAVLPILPSENWDEEATLPPRRPVLRVDNTRPKPKNPA